MKWHQRHKTIIIEAIALLLVILFTYAGLTKLLEGHRFYDNIRNSPILGGETIASLASWMVPLAELAVALILIWKKTRLLGLYGAMGLILLFTGYTIAIVFFAPFRPCSCGGIISLLSWEQHLVFNVILLLLALLAIWCSRKQNEVYRKNTRQGT